MNIKAGQFIIVEKEGVDQNVVKKAKAWMCANGGGYYLPFDSEYIYNHASFQALPKTVNVGEAGSISRSTVA